MTPSPGSCYCEVTEGEEDPLTDDELTTEELAVDGAPVGADPDEEIPAAEGVTEVDPAYAEMDEVTE